MNGSTNTASALPVLRLPGMHMRAWLHEDGDLTSGTMIEPIPTPEGMVDFFGEVARAEPHVVFLPYTGTWDGQGRRVYAYDLLEYADYHRGEESDPVYGVALLDDHDVSDLGEWRRRYHYNVEQVTTAYQGETEITFWHHIHSYEGGMVYWSDVDVVGNLFEDFEMLQAWGVRYDLPEVLRRLRLQGPERWGCLRIPGVPL